MRPARSSKISLRETLPDVQIFGSRDIRIASCCGDPQSCRPGDLYVAMQSASFDGHDSVDQAVQRGARAIVAERHLPVDIPIGVVQDSREAFGYLCQQLAGQPSQRMRTVGISGSHGKTTTAWLLSSIFRAAGQRCGSLSSNRYTDSEQKETPSESTPPASELADWMARMALHGCANAVLEVSSHALAERRLAGVGLDLALLTNVRREHLELHGSLDSYRRAKMRLFDHLKPGGVAVVNVDDPFNRSLLKHLECPVLTVGMRMPAELTATIVERHAGQQTMLLSAGNETAAVQTRMFGDHFATDCLMAAAAGLLAGLELTTVARGLEALDGVPGRLEPIACGQPFGVYVDAGNSPDALAATLRSLRKVTQGRLICVFGADSDRDPGLRPLLGRVVERGADLGVITNDNPRWEKPLEIAHDIIDGYRQPAKAHILPDRAKAIRWALTQARGGDAVLIAGRGDRLQQEIRNQQCSLDDREVARQCLYGTEPDADDADARAYVIPFPSRA